jgi:ribose transport system ATP-binding protein
LTPDAVLCVSNLHKAFGRIAALRAVDLELAAGEIHGLCGENGAGKSTLVKVLAGLVSPSEGNVVVAGSTLRAGRRTDPRLISVVHQELSIVPDLSVLDNVLIGDETGSGIYLRRRYADAVRGQIDALGLGHVHLDQPARELTLAEQQLVEIARGVSRGARVLVLDEPTATLSDSEIRRVFAAVRWLRDRGSAVLFITHRLPEIFELTERVTVLRNGQRVLTRPTSQLTSDELVRAMIGRDLEPRNDAAAPRPQGTRPRLRLSRLALDGAFEPMDLSIAAGEIVAVVGQLGSGADLLVETLAGLRRQYTGSLSVDDRIADVRSTGDALRHGIAYVPEDRAGKGVFLDARVDVNLTASILGRLSRAGFLAAHAAARAAEGLASRFGVDRSRLTSAVSQLSGGNQQKVALAKAAAYEPRVLVLNEPTRGVDVGARAEIYKRLREMAVEGLSIVFFTTDLEEIAELADRVVTVFRGAVVNDRPRQATSMSDVLKDILHGSGEAAA